MQITLPSDVEKAVREKLDSGAFSNPEDVVRAALVALRQQEDYGDFQAGEMDQLLADGESSIEKDGTLDGDAAFNTRRQRRVASRGTST